MRELTSHKVNGLNEVLRIAVLDEPGQGNANHLYEIGWGSGPDDLSPTNPTVISFQNGPISESGVNGISGEALLAIVEDRLLGFQSGQYACRENAIALTKLQEAMMWLQKRTRDRVARGVEMSNNIISKRLKAESEARQRMVDCAGEGCKGYPETQAKEFADYAAKLDRLVGAARKVIVEHPNVRSITKVELTAALSEIELESK